ncbi:MAG: YolD-like family protein [Lachnospiraceae bacterium]|nr:YolD-like family protein [Candidatus Merdinaster equi]
MDRETRAKQFMPFAALKGYEAALRAKEKIVVPRAELSEESRDALDLKFRELSCGKLVSVTYYDKSEYVKKEGMVSKIDTDARLLHVVNTKIRFGDIYSLEFIQRQL